MVDYLLDSDFEIETTSWGALRETSGLQEFEQTLAVRLADEMKDIIGSTKSDNLIENRIRLAVNRIAGEYEKIDKMDEVQIERRDDVGLGYRVKIFYYSDEPFIKDF